MTTTNRIPGLTNDVLATARNLADFNGKAFISEVYASLPSNRGLTLRGFKAWLLEAQRAGTVTLARADLAPAFDQATVRASKIEDMGSTFHFIRAR